MNKKKKLIKNKKYFSQIFNICICFSVTMFLNYLFLIEKKMSSRNAEAISEIFNKYDKERTGYISKSQLKDCIFDLNGRKIDDVEVFFFFFL